MNLILTQYDTCTFASQKEGKQTIKGKLKLKHLHIHLYFIAKQSTLSFNIADN